MTKLIDSFVFYQEYIKLQAKFDADKLREKEKEHVRN